MDYKVIDYKWLDKDDKKIALTLNNDNSEVGDTVNYKINGKSYEMFVMRTLYDEREGNSVICMINKEINNKYINKIKNILK